MKMDDGDGSITVCMLTMPQDCTLKKVKMTIFIIFYHNLKMKHILMQKEFMEIYVVISL